MIVRSNVSIDRYDNTRWVLSTPAGKHFVVNERTTSLFKMLRKSDSWEEAHRSIQAKFEISIDLSQFRELVREVLGGTGLLMNEEGSQVASYLRFRQPILSREICGFLSRIFPPQLFQSAVFWPLFWIGAFSMVAVAAHISVNEASIFSGNYYFFAPILLIGGMLSHELGHIAACQAKNISHGPIGFGIYFLYPVMYADITNVWTLSRSERLIVNLSGIYAQFIYVAALVGINSFIQDGTLLFGASAVAISSGFQLNPFARRDGYWVLSDALCIPNLVTKSKAVVLRSGHRFVEMIQQRSLYFPVFKPLNAFLFLYGIINGFVIFIFVGFMAVQYGWELIDFPYTLLSLIQEAGTGNLAWSAVQFKYLLFIALYIIIIRHLIAGGRSFLQRILLLVSNAGRHW